MLATQTLPQRKPKPMEVRVEGELPHRRHRPRTSCSGIIGRIGIGGGIGHVIEYTGSAIRGSVDGRPHDGVQHEYRGRRAGGASIAPDDTTFAYVEGRPHAPKGAAWEAALDSLARSCAPIRTRSSSGRSRSMQTSDLVPHVTWGTNPGMVAPITGRVPDPAAGAIGGRPARHRAGAALHGPAAADADPGHRRWIGCSSARARTLGSKTCAPRPRSSAASRSTRACGRWSCPARTRSRSPPSAKAWTACSPTLASSGARRAAACAWA